ncbi:MAG: hypothetical protein O7A08_11330 [SAR324 cluster bacterium]|nr:hypothetical protein [SAR324 cluster bacterium]
MVASVPYLDGERLRKLLPPLEAQQAVQSFFTERRREELAAPPRSHLEVPGSSRSGLYMPAATDSFIAVKFVHRAPERQPLLSGDVFLYDAANGRLLLTVDAGPFTALRTAAVTAAATCHLRPRSRRLLVFGAGVQAASHLAAFSAAWPELEAIHVVTRTEGAYRRLLANLSASLAGRVKRCTDTGTELARADCIVAASAATAPLFHWGDVPQTCHISAIGSAVPAKQELPPEAFLECRSWVDTPVALQESGDCLAALKAGWSAQRLEGDLFDLLESAPGSAGRGRTLFKGVGEAAQDLAVMMGLWRRLQGKG